MTSMIWSVVILNAAIAVLAPGTGRAQESGVIPFQSAGSLKRSAATVPFTQTGESATRSGDLQFPEGQGPFPAVVLAHGCAGNRFVEPVWGTFLRHAGYATFNIDSFRGRDIGEVCSQPGLLSSLQRVPDAYGALRLLALHPKVDRKRIALMGFSHGGFLTMLASTAWAKETYASGGQPAFRAFFPFYPYCNGVFPERNTVSAPVRIHIGAEDDWTPAKPCAELAASLKSTGHDVTISVYADAGHGFEQSRSNFFIPSAFNAADCTPQAPSILGPVVPSSLGACVKRGASIGPNFSAAEQARKTVRAQLEELLK